MNVFSLFCSFLPLILCTTHDITLENLNYSFQLVNFFYQRQLKDVSYKTQFVRAHTQLHSFINQQFETDPIELFKSLEENRNFHLGHFVVCNITAVFMKNMAFYIWVDNSFESFFTNSKCLMKWLLRSMDWTKAREILRILLSIHWRFLPRTRENYWKRRLENYKFIYHHYNPGDKDAFLHVFYSLRSQILSYNERVPTKTSFKRLFKLFNLYRVHFLSTDREKLGEISKLPPKFLFSLIFRLSYGQLVKLINNSFKFSLGTLSNFEMFQKALQVYRKEIKLSTISTNKAFKSSSEFIKFVRESTESDANIFDLDEEEWWILKGILVLIPIYIH
jgi:hypothetical protein